MASNTHDAGHGAADAAHGSSGMPQLDFSTYGNQIFWLLVTLVVIYLILSRVALPMGSMPERQHHHGTQRNDRKEDRRQRVYR